jgi:RluA family pseudouridine synthase
MWLNNHVQKDPEAVLGEGSFRLNLPAYEPKIYYEADPARIVFQDEHIIIYDKESGPPTVPAPHDAHNNIQAALERYLGTELRTPHRLDAPTSGLVVMALSRQAAGRLGQEFQSGGVKKKYVALSRGSVPSWTKFTVEAAVNKKDGRYSASFDGPGAPSSTVLTSLGSRGERALFMAEPLTGRTHQIRLHLALMGHPIVGDKLYGGETAERLMLRASGLSFRHPETRELLSFRVP